MIYIGRIAGLQKDQYDYYILDTDMGSKPEPSDDVKQIDGLKKIEYNSFKIQFDAINAKFQLWLKSQWV